jgi:hypothetical protein
MLDSTTPQEAVSVQSPINPRTWFDTLSDVITGGWFELNPPFSSVLFPTTNPKQQIATTDAIILPQKSLKPEPKGDRLNDESQRMCIHARFS